MASNISDDKKIKKLSESSEDDDLYAVTQPEESASSSTKKLPVPVLSNLLENANVEVSKRRCWDPLLSSDWDAAGPPGHLASTRIKRDLSSLFKEPLPGIFAIPDEQNFSIVHCLVLGPFETPYEGGFFHFVVRFGPSYPIHPPRVRLITTDAGKVRFNPNLYANGKVCLSILGTWAGPVWSPALNLGSLLLSMQSLLNEKPYFNEPGFKSEHYRGESDRYNILVTHETLRVAVCGQLEHILYRKPDEQHLPSELADVIRESFVELYDEYVDTCNKYKHLDGQQITDIFFTIKNRVYAFSSVLERLKSLKETIDALPPPLKKGKDTTADEESSLSSFSDEERLKGECSSAVIDEANDFLDVENNAIGVAGSSSEQELSLDDPLFFLDNGDNYDEDELEEAHTGNDDNE